MRKIISKAVSIAVILMLLLSVLALGGCAAQKEFAENTIISTVINDKKTKITLKAALTDEYVDEHSDENVYLLATESAYTGKLKDVKVIAHAKVKGSLTFRVGFERDTMLTSAFVLARLVSGEGKTATYEPITRAAYITNPEILSKNSVKANNGSYKGFSTDSAHEAALLGASSLLFEADISELLLPEYKDGAINYFYGGRSYYFDGEAVSELDKKISEASLLSMRVYLRTVLKYPERNASGDYDKEPMTALYCSGAIGGKQGYLPNLLGGESEYIAAFYSFLATRYNGEDKQHGLVLDYIIGYGVNNYKTNCNVGVLSEDEAIAGYYSWAQLASNILRSNNKNAQIYISVDNGLQSATTSSDIGIASFLPRFAHICSTSSEWDFSVALTLGNADDLAQLISGSTDAYSSVGPNNLSSFFEILSQEELLCSSKPRDAIIDYLSLPNSVSESNRAAYYTYAYYKAAEAGFDAFIYAANSDQGELYSSAQGRSGLYYAALMCGSNIASQLSEYTDKITGASTPSFKEHEIFKLTLEQSAKTELGETVLKNKKKFSLPAEAFRAMGGAYDANVSLITNASDEKKQTITVSADLSKTHATITAPDVSAKALVEAGYLGITMSSSQKAHVALIITKAQDNSTVYIGEADLSASPTTYYFNIMPFVGSISSSDELEISLCIYPDGQTDDVKVNISEMNLYGTSGRGGSSVVVIVAVCIAGAALLALLILLSTQRKRKLKHSD